MISRFFSNAMPRRFLCVLLVLLTCFCALSSSLVQPAEAVAVADDILLASLGLLAASWAGITFTTNAGANTAISNLLESKPAVKASLAGLITKNLVVDGAKLLLTSDVRDAFKTVLPEIKSYFQTVSTSEDSPSLALSPLPIVYILDGTDVVPSNRDFIISKSVNTVSSVPNFFVFHNGHFFNFVANSSHETYDIYVDGRSSRFNSLTFFDRSFCFYSAIDYKYETREWYYTYYNGSSLNTGYISRLFGTYYNRESSFVCYVPSSVDFKQSKEVDGTSALEILQPAPLYVVDPSGGDDKDPTEGTKPEINFKYGMLALEGLIGALTLSGPDAQKDPDIDPKKMIEELKKAMEQSQENPDPNPDPDPDPEPDPDPAPDPTDPDSPSSGYDKPHSADWKNVFPFCVPFDLIDFLGILAAEPEAPKFTWRFYAPPVVDQEIEIDLSPWDGVAQVVRTMELLAFCVGLILLTRNIIRG